MILSNCENLRDKTFNHGVFSNEVKLMKKVKKEDSFSENLEKLVDATKLYLPSAYGGWKNRELWKDINTYCLFLGYPRSGHSLIGALLNANPNIVIAHELGDLKYAYLGFRKWQLYYLLMKKAELSAQKERKLGGYNYHVPDQWQGKFTKIKVIGDKQGEGTTLRIQENPQSLESLRQIVNVKLKFVHIIRNPYDNITTMSKKTPKLDYDLLKSIDHYFFLCDTISQFKQTLKSDEIYELKHELFLEEPKFYLKEICNFLGVYSTQDYLECCSKIVYKSPHKSRHTIDWQPQLIAQVQDKINQYSFLSSYTYNN